MRPYPLTSTTADEHPLRGAMVSASSPIASRTLARRRPKGSSSISPTLFRPGYATCRVTTPPISSALRASNCLPEPPTGCLIRQQRRPVPLLEIRVLNREERTSFASGGESRSHSSAARRRASLLAILHLDELFLDELDRLSCIRQAALSPLGEMLVGSGRSNVANRRASPAASAGSIGVGRRLSH